MKRVLAATAAACALAASGPTLATEVGVSVQISQPGIYGRIDIGRFPQPQLVLQQSVIIARPVAVQAPPPVYMWVPPGHRKNWRRHCAAYGACGVPVYFVRDEWYGEHVHPQGREPGRGHGKDHSRGHGGKKGD